MLGRRYLRELHLAPGRQQVRALQSRGQVQPQGLRRSRGLHHLELPLWG
jgi:hypothetical protein